MRLRNTLCLLAVAGALAAASPAAAKTVKKLPGAKATDLPKGALIRTVACRAAGEQTYALYLPSNYDPKKRWPIVYGFDAGARGAVPVKLFSKAAERWGFILAASNNSRNGPMEPINAAMEAMWKDTHDRFAIDDSRVYATGFSGGARVACRVGFSRPENVAGVIGCSGGLPQGGRSIEKVIFPFFGIAGTADFNRPELEALDERLEREGMPHRLVIFKGGHTWPPEDACAEALEWMQMLAFRRTEKREKDRVKQLLKQGLARGESYEKAGELYGAYVRYRELADGFEGMCDTSAAREALARLDAREEMKEILAKKEAERDRRRELRERFRKRALALQEELGDPAKRSRAIGDLKKEVNDKETGEVARRLLEYIMMIYMQEAGQAVREKKYEDAVRYMETVCEVVPSNGRMLYNLACACSLAGDTEKALDALRRAVEHGWKDADHTEKDPDLKPLRENPAFKEILSGLRAK